MMRNPDLPEPEDKEAVWLAWKSLHIPVGTLLIGSLLVAGIASAIGMIWSLGPVNSMP